MRETSDELVETVRTATIAWGAQRGLRWADIDDLVGDALEWLLSYEPPAGWHPKAATLHALRWQLGTIVRNRTTQARLEPTPIGLDPAGRAHPDHWRNDPGYAAVELELVLDAIPDPDERQALIAVATRGDAAELARRQHVDLSTIHHTRHSHRRASRSRAPARSP